jgi:hypothetical protein
MATSLLEMARFIDGTRKRTFAQWIGVLNEDALRMNCGYFPTRSKSLAHDRPLHTSFLYRLLVTLYHRLRIMGFVASKMATASRASPRNDASFPRHGMSILPYIADSTTEGSRDTISVHPLSYLPCLDSHGPTTAGARYRSNSKSPEEIECASRSQHAR